MVKLIERAGEVSRVIEFDTVAELVEYEKLTGETVEAEKVTLDNTKPYTDKGAPIFDGSGYIPFIKAKTLTAHIHSQKVSGETVVASRDNGLKYLVEVDANQLIWSNK